MGRDKALLPFGPDEVLLERVVRLVSEVVPAEQIVCVAAAGQTLPPLANGVQVVRDVEPDLGPLNALATGLVARSELGESVFVCGCDSPLLVPALVGRLFELLGERQAIVPSISGQIQPLMAVYRADVLAIAESMLAAGRRSLHALVERCEARIVDAEELRDVDTELSSLECCNTREEYERLVERVFPSRVEP